MDEKTGSPRSNDPKGYFKRLAAGHEKVFLYNLPALAMILAFSVLNSSVTTISILYPLVRPWSMWYAV